MSDLKQEQVRDDNYNELSKKLDGILKLVTLGSKEVLQIEDVVILTGLSKSHIYRLTSKRKIPHSKPTGGFIYFKRSEIEEWMLQNKILTTDEIDSKASTYIALRPRG